MKDSQFQSRSHISDNPTQTGLSFYTLIQYLTHLTVIVVWTTSKYVCDIFFHRKEQSKLMTPAEITPEVDYSAAQRLELIPNSKIAGTLKIGVTGHRQTNNAEKIAQAVREILSDLNKEVVQQAGTIPFTLAVISSLAEGSDRIVAKEVLRTVISPEGGRPWLEAILPFSVSEYEKDFKSEQSADEFRSLLSESQLVKSLNSECNNSARERAYQKASRHIVDSCDVLIAVWDGRKGEGLGGTADTIEYAKSRNARVYLIPEQEPSGYSVLKEGPRWSQFIEGLRRLDVFNRENLREDILARSVSDLSGKLKAEAAKFGLESEVITGVCQSFLPRMLKADLLSQRCRKQYAWVGSAVYWLSALAVITVTTQTLFFKGLHKIIYFEVVFMAIILILLSLSRTRQWQTRWIDYRFLAERLRAGFYLRLSGISCERPAPPPYLSLSHSQDDWMVSAFTWIWNQTNIPSVNFGSQLKRFIKSSWVDDQVEWYKKMSEKLARRHKLLAAQGYVLFTLTLIAGLLHATLAQESLTQVLTLFAISFPAIGSALAGIREHRDLHKNSARYNEMARHLHGIGLEIEQSENAQQLAAALNHANEIMLREHQDWRVVILFHRLEPT
jgi:hypothetical protein